MKTSSIVVTLILLFINSLVIAQTDAVTILPNGNVGIGTTTPTQELQVNGNIQSSTTFIGHGGYGNNYASFSYKGFGNQKTNYALLHRNDGKTILNASIGLSINFRINNDEKMILDKDGNFGIGITTPAQKLHVNGNIQSATGFIGDGGYGASYASFSYKGLGVTKGNYALLQHNSGATYLNAVAEKPIYFRQGNKDKMILDTNGNVGIGITNPNAKLYIKSNASDPATVGTNALTIGSSNISDGRLQIGISKGYSWIQSHRGQPLAINVYNNVGIGTATPTQGKLVVHGTGSTQSIKYGYLNSTTPAGKVNSNQSIGYSIYATGRIASTEFNAYSDLRIKNVIGHSNATYDLATLSKIKITDYTLIDTVTKGNKTHKKVIAQQLKEIYPQAVSNDLTDVIPSIYAVSTIKDGWIQTTTKDLVVGDKIKLIFSKEEALVTVLEIKENAIKVASDQEGDVFVYGKQISDFHTVDYEAISMLNVSATQALLKRIQQLEKDKETLSRKQKQLEDHLNDSASRIEKLETLFNNLK